MKKQLYKLFEQLTPPLIVKLIDSSMYTISLSSKKERLKKYDKLHLACGPNILDGWSNIDLNRDEKIIRLDLTKLLPIANDSIQYIFSEHFIEHITRVEALSLLKECYRVMKKNAVIRITTPNLQKLITEYNSGKLNEWKNVGWLPSTSCKMMNEGMRLWGHQFVYDEDELKLLLQEAGFENIKLVALGKSEHKELEQLECRPFHDEIIIEATR